MPSELGLWLRDERRSRGWSGAEMARRLRQAAAAVGDQLPSGEILAAYIRRWEHGGNDPTERYRLHYSRAFGLPPDELGSLRPGVAGASDGASPGEEALAGAHDVAAEESLSFAEWAGTSNVQDAALEEYALQAWQLAADCQHETPQALLLSARRLRDRLFTRLHGHQRLGQARELYLAAAQVCALMAWMSGDAGAYRAGAAHAWAAWACAEQAGDDGTRALVRATQSKLAYWDGRYADSAQLAADGLRLAGAGSSRAILGLFLARALARLGSRADAMAALGRAGDGLGRGGGQAGGLWEVSPARFHGMACEVHLWLADGGRVLSEARQALVLFGDADPRQRNLGAEAHTRIAAAHAHLMRRDIDGADAVLRPVLALPAARRYEPITQELGRVRRELAGSLAHAGAGRGLAEEIEAYCRESAVTGAAG
jgi:transcriptional regulator with XRE-family HTH domain